MPQRSSYIATSVQPSSETLPAAGERRLCVIRFAIFLVFLAYFLSNHFLFDADYGSGLGAILQVGTVWFVLNLVLYIAIRAQRFRSWMAVASVFADVAVVAALNIATVQKFPLNYTDNLIFTLYFIAIALSAIRKKVWVVFTAGALASVSYLAISVYFQRIANVPDYQELAIDSRPQSVAAIAFLHQLGKSVALGVVGWVAGMVTLKIQKAQQKYQSLFNNVPDGIVLTSETGTVETVNQALLDLLQQPGSMVIGRPVNSLFQSEYRRNEDNAVITQRTSSTAIPVAITESTFGASSHLYQKILSVRNLSIQQKLRELISQTQQTEALGQIARGLAHDFNNLLGAMLGAVSLIRSQLARFKESPETTKLKRHALVIQDCAENARDILKRLLALSRASAHGSTTFNMRTLLEELRDFTTKTFGDRYHIQLTVESEKQSHVSGDQNAMFQALLNICLNARESMTSGGIINIVVREDVPSRLNSLPGYLRMSAATGDARLLEISICDQGQGMSAEVLRHCVEPFFTTKEPTRRGVGLGLSIANNIIRHQNGFMQISSEPGIGTTVTVYMPCLHMDTGIA